MVTVAQAIQGVEEAEESATLRESEIKKAEAQARKIRVGGTVREQLRFGSGLTTARREARRQRTQSLAEVERAREELGLFRGTLGRRREEIVSFQAQQRDVASFNKDLALARKLVARGRSPLGESKQVKELFKEVKEGTRIIGPKRTTEEIALEGFVGISTPSGVGFVPIGGSEIFTPIQSLAGGGVLLQGEPQQQLASSDLLATLDDTALKPSGFDKFVSRGRELISPGLFGESPVAKTLGRPEVISTGLFGELPVPVLGLVDPIRRRLGKPEIFPDTPIPTLIDVSGVLLGGIPREEKEQLASFFEKASLFSPLSILPKKTRKAIGAVGAEGLSFSIETAGLALPTTPLGVTLVTTTPSIFGALSPALRTVGLTSFGGLSGFELSKAETLQEKTVAGIGIGLAVGGIGFETFPFIKGRFARGSKTSVLGEEIFTSIKTGKGTLKDLDLNIVGLGKEFKVTTQVKGFDTLDVGLIPPGGQAKFFGERGAPKFKGNIEDVIKLSESNIPLRDQPLFPKLTKQERNILGSLGPGDEVISGSLARNILLKGQRSFGDIDIISKDVLGTTERILGSSKGLEAFQQPRAVTIRDIKTGKELADIVPFEVGEGGFVSKFPSTEVGGLNIADPRAVLGGKLTLLSEGIRGVRGRKAIKDVGQITGGAIDLSSPTIRGGFGFTFEEQLSFAGKRANIGISAIDFAKSLVGDVPLSKPLFGTPSKVGDPFLIRESRLGLGSDFFKFPSPQAETRIQFGGDKSQALLIKDVPIDTGGIISPKALKSLARRADLGDERAIGEILKLSQRFKTTGSESFVPSAQRRGELEVLKTGGSLVPKTKLENIRIRGKAVELFELEIGGLKDSGSGFSKGLNKLLKESRSKGFGNIPSGKQLDILRGVRKESGIDISRALGRLNIISPVGLGSFALGGQRLGRALADRRQFIPGIGRRNDIFDLTPRREPTPRRERREIITTFFQRIDEPPTTRRPPPPIRRPFPELGIDRRSLSPFIPTTFDFTRGQIVIPPSDKGRRPKGGFEVLGLRDSTKKGKRRFVRLNKKNALSFSDARDLGSFAIDNTISASFVIRKSKRRVGALSRLRARGHFSRNAQKFRPRKKGSKLPRRTFIEKRGRRLDTVGEIAGITLAKFLAPKRSPVRKRRKRR